MKTWLPVIIGASLVALAGAAWAGSAGGVLACPAVCADWDDAVSPAARTRTAAAITLRKRVMKPPL